MARMVSFSSFGFLGKLKMTEELPLDAPIVELRLTDEQEALFHGLAALARMNHGSVIFAVLASSYVPELGRGVVRLQAKLVPKCEAQKALKILRKSALDSH